MKWDKHILYFVHLPEFFPEFSVKLYTYDSSLKL